MNTKILNPNLDVVITSTGKVKIVTEIGGKLVAVNDRKLQNKLLYTASKKPQSWWIDANCYANVYDENTGDGYLLLNPDVTVLSGIFDLENQIVKNIFSNVNIFMEEPDIDVYSVVVPKQITALSNACFAILHGHMQSDDDLANITLPETINSILTSAISGRIPVNLTIYATTPPEIEERALNVALCYVPEEAFDAYTNNEGWSESCSAILPIGTQFAKMYYSANDAPDSSWIQENCILPLCHFDDGEGYLAIKDGVTRLYGYDGGGKKSGTESMFGVSNSVISVTIPSQITTIGELSFVSCHDLESVEIPETVTSIERSAFDGCDGLTSFVCKAVTPPTLNGSHIFDNIGTTTCIVPNETAVTNYQNSEWANYFTEFISQEDYCKLLYTATTKPESSWITENCTENVFDVNTGEGYLMLKPGVTSIWRDTEMHSSIFNDGSVTDNNITSIIIPQQIVEIDGGSTNGMDSLTTVYLPNTITQIGCTVNSKCGAFKGCSSLTLLIIPASVSSIGKSFTYGSGDVTCLATTPPELVDSFGAFTTDTLYVPSESVTAYQNNASWSAKFANILPIQE